MAVKTEAWCDRDDYNLFEFFVGCPADPFGSQAPSTVTGLGGSIDD